MEHEVVKKKPPPDQLSMNASSSCNNETVANGQCHGLSICGWCYDYGEARIVSKEYETFNSVSQDGEGRTKSSEAKWILKDNS
ncbi:hypothetical protein ANCDUO_00786 [Ancylostoma duodenale]|uniref:Uncharacterized protein n=1 Tax=Ancylostoma duodenale TaxID=51022 RepID=A0A0C2HB64_9BILA|nr:hypothetical protein ANCDUO_00786 [Ancylostoma duodenale]